MRRAAGVILCRCLEPCGTRTGSLGVYCTTEHDETSALHWNAPPVFHVRLLHVAIECIVSFPQGRGCRQQLAQADLARRRTSRHSALEAEVGRSVIWSREWVASN